MQFLRQLACLACLTLLLSSTSFADEHPDQSPTAPQQSCLCNAACDGCAGDGYSEAPDCCDCSCDCQRLLGMLPSDHCFDRFVSPLSNPFFFEDPRSLTEARGLFLDNALPGFAQGGDAQVWAAQLRGRLTDRLSFIAPRLGYIKVNQAANQGGGPEGFLSAPVGLKYNFIRDVDRQFLASAGVTYFIPGSARAFSNFGDGDFHFFLTGGKQFFDYAHWLSATGFRIPDNNNWGTQLWYWSNQLDCEVVDGWYGVFGVNWFHWLRSADNNFTGQITTIDLIDLPAGDVAGNDVVTGVVGLKWKPSSHTELGAAYEFPFTEFADILHSRVYVDFIVRY